MPLIEAVGVSKSFSGVQALRGVSFSLASGEVHALAGENGAGKSTLIRILAGSLAADSGEIRILGETRRGYDPAAARALGVAVVYQQPALFPHLTVAENIALAVEPGRFWRRVDWKQRRLRAQRLIAGAGGEIDPDRTAASLSMPEQQIVEIAKALGADARVLILDEPTASLTAKETERLFTVIAAWRARGAGVIYISHRLGEIESIADRITVLRDGESVGTRAMREVSRGDLIGMMAGREVSTEYPPRQTPASEAPAFEVRNLSSPAVGLAGISFSVRGGEIFGISGLVGSGRTQLAETIFGLRPPKSGEIRVAGEPAAIRSPHDAIRRGIAYLPEDRRRHGVIAEMPVAANITLATLDSVSRRGLLDKGREGLVAASFVDRLRIKTPSIDSETGSLSGGNQQKVALARWLAAKPKVLILDEPTQGVDVGVKSEIHSLISQLAAEGIAVILVSSELAEIIGLSDRIAVMRGGRFVHMLPGAQATPQGLLDHALGQSAERPA